MRQLISAINTPQMAGIAICLTLLVIIYIAYKPRKPIHTGFGRGRWRTYEDFPTKREALSFRKQFRAIPARMVKTKYGWRVYYDKVEPETWSPKILLMLGVIIAIIIALATTLLR